MISALIGMAGIILAVRRERKRSHLEIFIEKGSSDLHVKNVGSTDALELGVNVMGSSSETPIASIKGRRLRNEDELRVPLAGLNLHADEKLLAVATYRNTNDKEDKVRRRKRRLRYLPGKAGESVTVSHEPVLVPKQVLSRYRVAVLPLANFSPDPNNEYFSDGMTEELIDRLSRMNDLRIIARTSVMGYKKLEKKASEIGRELGVGTLVEGSVRKAGNRIRITVQLIDTKTEEHIWSSTYDRELDDFLAVQTEIAEKVSTELSEHLHDSERGIMETGQIEVPEGYAVYLLKGSTR